jgi:hypothetical protein
VGKYTATRSATYDAAIASSNNARTAATPHVVDVDECGAAVKWSHGFDGKIVGSTVVIGDLVSRHNQCA